MFVIILLVSAVSNSLWEGKAWDRNGNCPTVHIQVRHRWRAIRCTKYYEGWHGEKNIGPMWDGVIRFFPESFTNDIKSSGDSILRADMMKLCCLFSRFGRLSCCFVSCLPGRSVPLLGSKDFPKSKLDTKLEAGNRDILRSTFLPPYKGKVVPSIEASGRWNICCFLKSKKRENLSVYFRQFSRDRKEIFHKKERTSLLPPRCRKKDKKYFLVSVTI